MANKAIETIASMMVKPWVLIEFAVGTSR